MRSTRSYELGHSAVLADERTKDRTALEAEEDAAIRAAVRRQIDLGLDVVTDGEFRRWMFLNSFYDAVEGFRTDNVVNFRNARGEDVPLRVHEIVDRLQPVDSPAAREAAFMAGAADGHPFKVTFPRPVDLRAPVLVQARGHVGVWFARGVRGPRDRDRASARRRRDRGRRTLRPVRLPGVPVPRRPDVGRAVRGPGHDLAALVDAAIAADTAVLEGIPDEVTVALHICRGNYRSSWMCEGSLEPVAERVFGELPYDAFLVEWDDEGRTTGTRRRLRTVRHRHLAGRIRHGAGHRLDEDARARGRGLRLIERMEHAAGFWAAISSSWRSARSAGSRA